jgi:hypothetical protein
MSSWSKGFRPAFFIALLFMATVAAVSGQGENKVLVVSIVGNWKYQGAGIRFGQSLTPAPRACLSGSDGSVVLQTNNRNPSLHPFACEKPFRDPACKDNDGDRCAVPLDPENWKSDGVGSGNFWESVKQFVIGDPEKYMVAASRGMDESLTDAVVRQQAQNIDLEPAFREMDAGQYWLTLAPLNPPAAAGRPFEIRFSPHNPAMVPAADLKPGLYRLLLVDKSGTPAGSDCWILITPTESYPATSDAFRRATEMSAKWPEDMDLSAVRALLRAYLESLAKSQSKP